MFHVADDENLAQCAQDLVSISSAAENLPQVTKDLLYFAAASLSVKNRQAFFERMRSVNFTIQDRRTVMTRLAATSACSPKSPKVRIGMCSIQARTAPFLQPWLMHYFYMGFDKVIIYDNSDPKSLDSQLLRNAAKPFVDADIVEVVDWHFTDGDTYRQVEAYRDCYERNKNKFDWISFHDIDEFLYIHPPKTSCYKEYLEAYKDYGGLIVEWRHITPIGVVTHDFSKLHAEQYFKQQLAQGLASKTTMNTKYAVGVDQAHDGMYIPGKPAVNRLNGTTPEPLQEIELRHYWSNDYLFTIYEKLCGDASERKTYQKTRVSYFIDMLHPAAVVDVPPINPSITADVRKLVFGK